MYNGYTVRMNTFKLIIKKINFFVLHDRPLYEARKRLLFGPFRTTRFVRSSVKNYPRVCRLNTRFIIFFFLLPRRIIIIVTITVINVVVLFVVTHVSTKNMYAYALIFNL